MSDKKVNKWFFTPFLLKNKRKDKKYRFNLLFLSIYLIILSGCITTEKTNYLALAPLPPEMDVSLQKIKKQPQKYFAPIKETKIPHLLNTKNKKTKNNIISIAKTATTYFGDINTAKINTIENSFDKTKKGKKINCSIKDRFDRKSILAYEWGRNKISIDIDGINLKNSGNKAILFEYKLHIHPEKTKKELCRSSSKWQGIIGSSYNELFIRKDDTIWMQLNNIIKNISN